MAKEVVKKVKLQIPAGKANPAPPVGTVLGPAGINIQDFCQKFNDATKDKIGDVVPCEISIYDDRTFDFVLKTPPASFLLKKFAKIQKGGKKGANEVVATLTKDDIRAIAELKFPDLNSYEVENAMKEIEGRIIPDSQNVKIGIVASRFNDFIVGRLIDGALDGLKRHDIKDENMRKLIEEILK